MSAPLVAGAVCARLGCGHGEDLHDGICFGTACECVRFVGSAGALPVPVGPEPQALMGPQMPPFPPAPRTFEEKLRADVARLQGLLADATREVHNTRRERDLMRERVSEPYGCKHCGEARQSHGRRYVISAGMHSWERPSDEQVKDRMLARRAARFTSHPERLATLLVARTEELLAAEARVAELEAERHSTNESLSEAAEQLRVDRDRIAELEALTPAAIQTCRKCGAGYTYGEPCSSCAFKARMAAESQRDQSAAPGLSEDECTCPPADRPHQVGCPLDEVPLPDVGPDSPEMRSLREALTGSPDRPGREPEGEHYASVHHSYLKGRDLDLPETVTPEPSPVVAYRDPHNPRVLLCREHGKRWHGVYPVTAEDLPDGGICSFGRLSSLTCGRDVLTGERTETGGNR